MSYSTSNETNIIIIFYFSDYVSKFFRARTIAEFTFIQRLKMIKSWNGWIFYMLSLRLYFVLDVF